MTQGTPENAEPRFVIRGQYIKDLSFENPHAPQSLVAPGSTPKMDVNVNLRGQKLQESLYELTIQIAAKTKVENHTLFLVDLAYAGVFELTGIPADRIETVLLIDCPFVIFPFARRVIADVTRDGGFPPLLLDPIDFHALYMQNRDAVKVNVG